MIKGPANIKPLFKWFLLSLVEFLLIFVSPFILVWWYLRNDVQNLVLAFVMVVQLYILAFQAELSLRNETLTKLSYLPVFRIIARKGIPVETEDGVMFTKSIGDNPYGGIVLKNVGKFPAFNVVTITNIESTGSKDTNTMAFDVIPPDAERLVYKFSPGIDSQTFKGTRIEVTVTYTSFADDTKTVAFIKPIDNESFITFQSNEMPSFLLGIIKNLSMSTKLVIYKITRRKRNL